MLLRKTPLKVLILTRPFLPMIGGVENVTVMLAEALAKEGCKVTVGTSTPGNEDASLPFQVVRQPSAAGLWNLYRTADVVVLQGLSLNLGWPAFVSRKPLFIVHHGQYDASQAFDGLRKSLFGRGVNIAVSNAVGASLPGRSITLYNPYNAEVFRPLPQARKPGTLVFVGRLVLEKGILDLLDTMILLRDRFSLKPQLTIVGDGPLKERVLSTVAASGLSDQVVLAGGVRGEALARLLNEHEVAVIPSAWEEPFGIVALETIACGCKVVGTRRGGLPEAIGPCGMTVENGDTAALALAVKASLESPAADDGEARRRHLAHFQPQSVAVRFLELFENDKGVESRLMKP